MKADVLAFVSAIAGAYIGMLNVFAVQPGTPRDLANVDNRPITTTQTGIYAQLS